jgi:N-acetylglucosamine kinase-like BadF-type ATPase
MRTEIKGSISMKYVLAVDGGGTKTEVACADMDGKLISSSISGPTSLAATNFENASLNFTAAITQIIQKLPSDAECQSIVLGLAGLDTEKEVQFAKHFFQQKLQTLLPHSSLQVMNDIRFVLAAGSTQPNAVALISGTGSQCFGQNEAGETARVSGLDYLLSDQGSGYEIGRQVLRGATQSFDGRIPKSMLEQLVLNHFQVASFPELKETIYSPPLLKTQIAELAPLCFAALDQGDPLATAIINKIMEDLVVMVKTVIVRLHLEHSTAEVITSGSIIKLPHVFSTVKDKVKMLFPQITVKPIEIAPVQGGIKIALQSLS